jgi:hypothetical protein
MIKIMSLAVILITMCWLCFTIKIYHLTDSLAATLVIGSFGLFISLYFWIDLYFVSCRYRARNYINETLSNNDKPSASAADRNIMKMIKNWKLK